jgi:hypothetical protein
MCTAVRACPIGDEVTLTIHVLACWQSVIRSEVDTGEALLTYATQRSIRCTYITLTRFAHRASSKMLTIQAHAMMKTPWLSTCPCSGEVSHKKMISMNVPDTPSEDSLLLLFPNSRFLRSPTFATCLSFSCLTAASCMLVTGCRPWPNVGNNGQTSHFWDLLRPGSP